MTEEFIEQIEASVALLANCRNLLPALKSSVAAVVSTLRAGGTVAFCGNGGSASQAQHFAAELVARFRRERRALRAIALTTDTSILTAVGNDYSFDQVFSRQVEALLRPGDALVALSTSGQATNVCAAAETAREIGATVIGFTGRDGGRLASLCHIELRVPHTDTARIQEAHLLLGHLLCDAVEAALAG